MLASPASSALDIFGAALPSWLLPRHPASRSGHRRQQVACPCPPPHPAAQVFGAAFRRNSKWSTNRPVPEVGDADTPMDKVGSVCVQAVLCELWTLCRGLCAATQGRLRGSGAEQGTPLLTSCTWLAVVRPLMLTQALLTRRWTPATFGLPCTSQSLQSFRPSAPLARPRWTPFTTFGTPSSHGASSRTLMKRTLSRWGAGFRPNAT